MMLSTFYFLSGTPMTMVAGVFLLISLFMLFGWVSLPLDSAWLTILISGTPLVYLALTRLFKEKNISSALLISMAMAASIAIGEVFAAGEVAFIMAIGAILEERTVEKARKGLKNLISMAPQQARRLVAGIEEMVGINKVSQGDILRILPGETIPVDGVITSGNTSIDQSVMTGESLPVDKAPGDSVFSGTINRFGAIDIAAAKIGEDSSLQKLIRMVQEAENNKAPMQRIVDKWASWLVPIALVIAVLAYLFTGEIIRAVTVLVVFCPCALALATPTSIMAAIGQATKYGVIIKSGQALESMGKVDTIAFDKTGTLTHGTLEVSDVLPFVPELSSDALLQLTASVESFSEHPLGKAIVFQARDKGMHFHTVDNFSMKPGKGISSEVDGKVVLCGNRSWLEENGIQIDATAEATLAALRKQGKAAILIAVTGKYAGVVALSDSLRQSASQMVQELGNMDTQVVLLTGDHSQTADYFAAKAGIDTVYAELLPSAKVERIQELQRSGRTVCMIGDGVNDAPALKIADVGVAMGGMGSDIALDAADVALMGDDIERIPYLKRLSNVTIWTIKFNITLSMLINLVAVAMSVLGLLNPVSGALVHNAGSVLVVLNAARLYGKKLT